MKGGEHGHNRKRLANALGGQQSASKKKNLAAKKSRSRPGFRGVLLARESAAYNRKRGKKRHAVSKLRLAAYDRKENPGHGQARQEKREHARCREEKENETHSALEKKEGNLDCPDREGDADEKKTHQFSEKFSCFPQNEKLPRQ